MVELFTKCDEDYGRRVGEGLKMMASQKQSGVTDSAKQTKAVDKAETESTEAKPY